MGQSVATLVAATADSHAVVTQYNDPDNLTATYNSITYNDIKQYMRRNKAIEDAARAAAAAFDAGVEAKNNPVKLDSDRKLKAI